jgi:hypothetical protein
MVTYVTESELASYLQQDVDTATATQALTLALAEFSRAAETVFTPTSVTWSTLGDGRGVLEPPYRPVTAVAAVRVNGVTISGWTLRMGCLYRLAGFGYRWAWPPDQVDVDLTYGYTTVPDDVKLAVLEIAAGIYDHPTSDISVTVDDTTTRYDPEKKPSPAGRRWQDVAADYRGLLIA